MIVSNHGCYFSELSDSRILTKIEVNSHKILLKPYLHSSVVRSLIYYEYFFLFSVLILIIVKVLVIFLFLSFYFLSCYHIYIYIYIYVLFYFFIFLQCRDQNIKTVKI